jgi:hypothetical protein
MLFDREKIRLWIALLWVLVFVGLWVTFETFLPSQQMAISVENLKSSVEDKNWTEAQRDLNDFETTWKQHRIIIQAATAAEEVSAFQQTLEEVKVLVNNQDDSALGPISILKELAKTVTTAFSSP